MVLTSAVVFKITRLPSGWRYDATQSEIKGTPLRETGFSHVVITTANARQLGGFFAALDWQQQSTPVSADAADFWGADGTRAAESWVAPSGACEVVLLPVANTTPVLRPVECAVTTPGGLFDINMRTWDSEWARDFLHTHGWRELVPAVAWQFGEVHTSEGLYIQDDGIVMAVMQRLSPPLEGIEFDRMSDVFNSTQMVSNVEATLAFLKVLGFERFIDHAGPLPGEGPRVLQLEQYPVETAGIHLSIAHPEAAMSGSIELIDVPEHPLPCLPVPSMGGRGLRALAIPCNDVAETFAAINDSRWSGQLCQPLAERDLPGLLGGQCFAVTAPDGGRLDFYQITQ
jgi:hypothetical protein